MKYKQQIFYVYLVAVAILTWYADVSNGKPVLELETQTEAINETKKTEEMLKQMDSLKTIPPMPFITHGPYIFEGVDLNLLPEKMLNTYTDCYGQHGDCIRNLVYFNTICAYDIIEARWVNIIYHCQIALTNCLLRVKRGIPMNGVAVTNDQMYYNGEGNNCIYYIRRAGNREDAISLYFEGTGKPDEIKENNLED